MSSLVIESLLIQEDRSFDGVVHDRKMKKKENCVSDKMLKWGMIGGGCDEAKILRLGAGYCAHG